MTQPAAVGPEVAADNPVLAEVVRSGFAESRHRGAIAAVDTGGGPLLRVGLVDVPMFPRSSNKPMQAAAMLRCGLGLSGELLALAAASHSGEDFHVAGVREILARKIYHLRILRDEKSCADTGAPLLVISQFTLYAETRKGRRPTWQAAAPGPVAEPLVTAFADALRELGASVQTGVFGADMQVMLVNDGPVTLILEA